MAAGTVPAPPAAINKEHGSESADTSSGAFVTSTRFTVLGCNRMDSMVNIQCDSGHIMIIKGNLEESGEITDNAPGSATCPRRFSLEKR
jgi:hypothetical protein